MEIFCCPVCGTPLTAFPSLYTCRNGHSFDRSRYGYVNLLMSQKSAAKHSGDDKKMVKARKEFLSAGYYEPLREELLSLSKPFLKKESILLDAGCGEGYYTEGFLNAFEGLCACGIDISKDALIEAGKRHRDIHTAVAGIFRMPVLDASCDLVLNVFAPCSPSEFHRVLKKDGVLLRVIPMENHLWELKEAIYDKPYHNEENDETLEGFTLEAQKDVVYRISLSPPQIQNLFMMTPYYYKTSAEDQAKCEALTSLDTQIEFRILLYKKADR